jgi:type II secretory pathway pseudopilin PulG
MMNQKQEAGFSYIDVMIAIVIMLVGILAMLSALTANLVRSYETEKRIIAKQMALSSIESIISAKEIERAGVIEGWQSIRNVIDPPPVGVPNGIFLTGSNPVRERLGADGVAGTADDACPAPGACGTNTSAIVPGYWREIIITDLDDPERPSPPNNITRRRVDVNIRYGVTGGFRTESAATIVTDYETLDPEDLPTPTPTP